MNKRCRSCGHTKPIEAFAKGGVSRYNGQPVRKSICKPCANERQRGLYVGSRSSGPRVHSNNAVQERCPHGGGIRPFRFVGYRGKDQVAA